MAAAAGHDPGDKGMQTIRAFLTVKGSRFTASMLHDLEKGAMVEADHVVGDMIARAKKAGIATPNLRLAYAHLQVYLARRARSSIGRVESVPRGHGQRCYPHTLVRPRSSSATPTTSG